MTQREVEEMLSVLDRRKDEERNIIERVHEEQMKKMNSDKEHTIKRIQDNIRSTATLLASLKDEVFMNKCSESWRRKMMELERMKIVLKEYQNELNAVYQYYRTQRRLLLDKRDGRLMEIIQHFSKERSRLMSQVDYPKREDKASYWKSKYYKLKAEVDKQKEKAA